jgi:hypothetical protein
MECGDSSPLLPGKFICPPLPAVPIPSTVPWREKQPFKNSGKPVLRHRQVASRAKRPCFGDMH